LYFLNETLRKKKKRLFKFNVLLIKYKFIRNILQKVKKKVLNLNNKKNFEAIITY